MTGADLSELARLQYLAGEFAAARATLAHAQRILPLASVDMFDGSQIRHDYSASLFHAGIELKGGGDAGRAQELLGQLDRMLANYEKNGGQHYGLYSLRAASLAMQGKNAEAEVALDDGMEARLARHVARARRPVSRSGQDARRSRRCRLPLRRRARAGRLFMCSVHGCSLRRTRAFYARVSRPSNSPRPRPSAE